MSMPNPAPRPCSHPFLRLQARIASAALALALCLIIPAALPQASPSGAGESEDEGGGPPRASLPARLAIEGLDPVRLLDDGEEVGGLDELSVVDGSWRYVFESPKTRKIFLKSPDRYRFASGETCAVMPGLRANPTQWTVLDGRLYGFSTPSARIAFIEETGKYLDEKGRLKRWHDAMTVAVPLYPGFEWADVGVSEAFGVPGREGFFRVRLLASDDRLVPARTAGAVAPDATFDEMPDPDIIIVPGGELDGALADAALMEWLRRAGAGAERILAVNNGPWLLAEAGLLDGHEAVIHPALNSVFQAVAPKVKVVPNTRWIESDGVLTATGAAAGLEAAIKVVGDFRGQFRGQMTARYFGIIWQPEMTPVPKDYSYLEEDGEAAAEPAGETEESEQEPTGGSTPAREPPASPGPRP